jgi:hypothetical protein
MTVGKLLNRGGEVIEMGLGGKQLDFMCDMDAPYPSLGTSCSGRARRYNFSSTYTCSIIRARALLLLAESGSSLYQLPMS